MNHSTTHYGIFILCIAFLVNYPPPVTASKVYVPCNSIEQTVCADSMRIDISGLDFRIYAALNEDCSEYDTNNYMTFDLHEISETFNEVTCQDKQFADMTFETPFTFSEQFDCIFEEYEIDLEGHVATTYQETLRHKLIPDFIITINVVVSHESFNMTHTLEADIDSPCVNGTTMTYSQSYGPDRAKFGIEIVNFPWQESDLPSTLFFHPRGTFVGDERSMFKHFVDSDGFHNSVLDSDDFDIYFRIHSGFTILNENDETMISVNSLETYNYLCNGESYETPLSCWLGMDNETKNIEFYMNMRLGTSALGKYRYIHYDPDFRVLFKIPDEDEPKKGVMLAYIITPIVIIVAVIVIIVTITIIKRRKRSKKGLNVTSVHEEIEEEALKDTCSDPTWKAGEKPIV